MAPSIDPEEIPAIKELLKDKSNTYKIIGKQYAVSEMAIYRFCKKHRLKR